MTEHVAHPFPDLEERVEKRICVIGAGANGLALLKVLLDTPQVKSGRWTVVCFEEREDIGGIWFPSPAVGDLPATPLYDSLTTNIPHPVMAYESFPFPPETPLYPPASLVLKYLNAYADHFALRKVIQLSRQVKKAHWSEERSVWQVALVSGEDLELDTLLVSNGHYNIPRYPDTPGLVRWIEAGKALHSIWYRRPEQFAKYHKMIVVGGGPSARDLCVDLCAAGKYILQSKYPGDAYALPETDTYRKVPPVAEYQDGGNVIFEDGSKESGVEFVVLGTGYETSFPFLSPTQLVPDVPPVPPPFPAQLYNSTYHVFPLAKHMFPLQATFPYHSAAFTGLLFQVAPFPIYEDQGLAIVRVLEDPSALDVAAESVALIERTQRLAKEKNSESALAIAKAWFRCGPTEGFEYREELRKFAHSDDTWTIPQALAWMWERKSELRSAWESVERRGEAAQWLKGVGYDGLSDWDALCRKLLDPSDKSIEEERSSSRL